MAFKTEKCLRGYSGDKAVPRDVCVSSCQEHEHSRTRVPDSFMEIMWELWRCKYNPWSIPSLHSSFSSSSSSTHTLSLSPTSFHPSVTQLPSAVPLELEMSLSLFKRFPSLISLLSFVNRSFIVPFHNIRASEMRIGPLSVNLAH